jgi:hypothetical protein
MARAVRIAQLTAGTAVAGMAGLDPIAIRISAWGERKIPGTTRIGTIHGADANDSIPRPGSLVRATSLSGLVGRRRRCGVRTTTSSV